MLQDDKYNKEHLWTRSCSQLPLCTSQVTLVTSLELPHIEHVHTLQYSDIVMVPCLVLPLGAHHYGDVAADHV